MSDLKFGWAEVDITPKRKIALDGEFFERVTDEVETPLSVTALAIQSGEEQAIICSCDLVVVSDYLMQKARENIQNPQIDKDKVLACAIHSHNAYVYTRNKKDGGVKRISALEMIAKLMPKDCVYHAEAPSTEAMDPDDALEFLGKKIAEAVEKAFENLEEGGYKAAFGRVPVGMSRRVCYSDGTAKMWGDVDRATFTCLEGGNDNGMELLFIYDKEGKMTGIVSNICCPAQVMEQRNVISSDYWGKVKILMREKYGEDLKLLALCGPAGDLCPRDLIRWVEPETPIKDPNVIRSNPKKRNADPSMFDIKGTWRIGKRIVNEMELILDETKEEPIVTSAPFKHKAEKVNLPLRKVTESDKAEAEKAIAEFFKGKTQIDYMDTAEVYVHTGVLNRYEQQKESSLVAVELHTVRLGNIVFASNPFELFLDYGNQIRARSDAEQTFLMQLCNGALGYLPTAIAEKHGHYSAYVSSGMVGHEGGDLLVRQTLEDIKRLFKE